MYVSLHNHTHYSILDALSSPKDLLKRAKELNQPAIAITDHGSVGSAWKALKYSKEIGIKLIIGCELYFTDDTGNQFDKARHIILLAKNHAGYINLLKLVRKGFDFGNVLGKKSYSVIDWKLLEEYHDGLICLTACGNGILGRLLMEKRHADADACVQKLVSIFGDDLGLEVQANNLKRGSNAYMDGIEQQYVNRQVISLAKKYNVKVIPTTNSHYIYKEQAETHDVLLAIGARQPVTSNFRIKYPVHDFYVKSYDEVKLFFSRNYGEEFSEQIIANSVEFANRCEQPDWIDPKFSNKKGKELPLFPVKDEPDYSEFLTWCESLPDNIKCLDEDKRYLRYKCHLNVNKIPEGKEDIYLARLAEEFDVIEFHGFSSYMLIVSDYIAWANNNGIITGPGRGSVGGSLIAYLINIHKADPIKYDLIFARFHNKEKKSYPDIDSDFATSGRERVKEYLRNKYGEDFVASVSNINTVTPKVYARDIARSCDLGGDRTLSVKVGNDIAGIIPNDANSIAKALKEVPLLGEYNKKYPEIEKFKEINGKLRAMSTHAGGVIISKRPLSGLVPLRKDKENVVALEYDKEDAEENGLVKMDILGLSTLDIIGNAVKLINKNETRFILDQLDYDTYDEKTYDLISEGNTLCVFQLGTSAGTIDLCRKIRPKNMMDLANINALARPSSKDFREGFISAKSGKKEVTLLHPKLERALGNTLGFGLYEECLLYVAQDIALWDLHQADGFRKLTKDKGKNPEKIAKLKKDFINDAVTKNNINESIAIRIWDEVVDNFQGYGFNISHAVFYSMIGYTTAYLKAHFPIEFLLANLMYENDSGSLDADENIAKIKAELRKYKVKILPPNINKSELAYSLQDNKLLTGLKAIKFVTDDTINEILEKRPFKNFFDFMVRVSSNKVRSNAIQALIASGALDCFNIPRRTMFLYCSDYRKKLQIWLKKNDPSKNKFDYPWPKDPEWNKPELAALERKYLGESFLFGKKDYFPNFFAQNAGEIRSIKKVNKTNIPTLKVEIKDYFEFKVKKESSKFYGKSMAKIVGEDVNNNTIVITVFPDRLERIKDTIKTLYKKPFEFGIGCGFHFSGSINEYDGDFIAIADNIFNVIPPPAEPDSLAHKSVKMVSNSKSKNLFDEVESFLINDGFIKQDDI